MFGKVGHKDIDACSNRITDLKKARNNYNFGSDLYKTITEAIQIEAKIYGRLVGEISDNAIFKQNLIDALNAISESIRTYGLSKLHRRCLEVLGGGGNGKAVDFSSIYVMLDSISGKDVEKQTQKLTKQQQTLASEIKKSKLAGKDISALKRDYTGVTKEIKKASAAQEALNRDLKRAEQFKRV